MEQETVRGVEVPELGLGTWRLTGAECRRAVSTALELGYRHVDTAEAYGNEREVGRAIEASDVPREDLFLTTKVLPTNAGYEDALAAIEDSLDRLGVDYVDLVLLHWPSPKAPLAETMRAFDEAREEGLTEHVGVSNFSLDRLRRARSALEGPLFANQVQFNPYSPKRELVRYCQDNDFLLMAYSPLGHGGLLEDRRLGMIGERYDRPPAQVALRWATQHENVVAIPKATSREHQAENLASLEFSMTEDELEFLAHPSAIRKWSAMARGRLGI